MKKLLHIFIFCCLSMNIYAALSDEVDENYLFENNGNAEIDPTNNNLTDNGTPAYGTTSPPEGTYYTDLGTADFFDDGDNALFDFAATDDYTMSFWVKWDTNSSPNVIAKGNQYQIGWGFVQVYTTAWVLGIKHMTNWTSEEDVAIMTTIPNTSVWYHVVVAYDEDATNEITIWLSTTSFGDLRNGDTANQDTWPEANTFDIEIGNTFQGTFDGQIDDFVFIKGYVANGTDAQALYNGGWRAAAGAEVQVITTVTG